MPRGWLWILALLGGALAQGYQVRGEVVYTARAPIGTFSGVNRTLQGEVLLDPGSGSLSGRLCLDLSAWDSQEPLRDRHTRAMFEVERYPKACLIPERLDPDKGLLYGTLDLHGVRKPVAWSLELSQGTQGVRFRARFLLRLSDYGLKAPRFMGMQVRDDVQVEVRGEGVGR